MKRILFISLFVIVLMGMGFSQPVIQKGNLISIHLLKYDGLKPGVTQEQLEDYYYNNWVPAWTKFWPEAEFIPLKSIRGEYTGKLGMFCIIKSEEDRDKYFGREGGQTEAGKKMFESLKPVFDGLRELVNWSDLSTDWLVL
jgi:hypothetical protein